MVITPRPRHRRTGAVAPGASRPNIGMSPTVVTLPASLQAGRAMARWAIVTLTLVTVSATASPAIAQDDGVSIVVSISELPPASGVPTTTGPVTGSVTGEPSGSGGTGLPTVDRPTGSPGTAASSPGPTSTDDDDLATTGTAVLRMSAIGLLLLAAGTAVVALTRRRTAGRHLGR